MTKGTTQQMAVPVGPVENRRPTRTYLFLSQVTSDLEAEVVERWIVENYPLGGRPPDVVRLPYPQGQSLDDVEAALGDSLERPDEPMLVPLRVVWLPKERAGERRTQLRDLLLLGDTRRPRPSQQRWIFRADPARASVLVAEPASLSELRAGFLDQMGPDPTVRGSFNRFVARRATLALERAESQRLGPRYKIPRLVREEIWTSARFQDGMARLAVELDRPCAEVEVEASAYLDEMVTGYNRLQIDLSQELGRRTYRRSYDEALDLDPDQVAKVQQAVQDRAAVVLPSHRSNHDAGVMPVAWHAMGLPHTHTLAGINRDFWPIGSIMRRSGVIFVREEISDNPVYRYVLGEYVGFLVEKRFHLEWYIEGGRSRTGKLLFPKLGLFTHVIDAFAEGRTDDVVLVPVSIAYDQLKEVEEYGLEAKGVLRKPGSAARFLRFWKPGEAYGKVYVRFGDPVSLRETLGRPKGVAVEPLQKAGQLQKLGFEVSWRINQATPITATALVTLALLSARGVAMTVAQLRVVMNEYLAFVASRRLPTTESCRALGNPAGMLAALDALSAKGVVVADDSGPEVVYCIGKDQHLAAAFYRNSIIHFFLEKSIAELALLAADAAEGTDREAVFWADAMAVRDLLKFEFFFQDREDFVRAIDAEMEAEDPDWRSYLDEDDDEVWDFLEGFGLNAAHTVLRSFFEAYQVVGSVLERLGDAPAPASEDLLVRCEGVGRQYLLQWRIASPESVSRPLFETGIRLAAARGLLERGDGLAQRRVAFAAELADVLSRLGDVETMSIARFRRALDRPARPGLTARRGLRPARTPV